MNLDSNTSESLGQAKPSDRHTVYSRLASGGQAISGAVIIVKVSTHAQEAKTLSYFVKQIDLCFHQIKVIKGWEMIQWSNKHLA